MHDDFHPYCVSYGDEVNITTDYSQDAEIWMKPSRQGLKSSVVEIPGNFILPICLICYTSWPTRLDEPLLLGAFSWFNGRCNVQGELHKLTFLLYLASWALDDWPPFHADPSRPGAQGYVSPDSIAASWKDSFTYCYNHYDTFIFPMSIHPQVSGMPHILMMHDR